MLTPAASTPINKAYYLESCVLEVLCPTSTECRSVVRAGTIIGMLTPHTPLGVLGPGCSPSWAHPTSLSPSLPLPLTLLGSKDFLVFLEEEARWQAASRGWRGSTVQEKVEGSVLPEPSKPGSCCSPASHTLVCCQQLREAATVSPASPGK